MICLEIECPYDACQRCEARADGVAACQQNHRVAIIGEACGVNAGAIDAVGGLQCVEKIGDELDIVDDV